MMPRASKDNTSSHTRLVAEIRLALGSDPDLVLWPNLSASVQVVTHDGKLIRMRTGLAVGSSDLVGIVTLLARHHLAGVEPIRLGRFFALEVKTGTGRTSPEQRMWLELVRSKGGFAAVVRSVEDAVEAVQRAREGRCE